MASSSSFSKIYSIKFLSILILVALGAAFHAGSSHAGGEMYGDDRSSMFRIDEVRAGVFAHDVEPDSGDSEDGVDINLEVLFGKPSWRHPNKLINHFIRPRPHIGGHINTSDSTSMFYFGLTWDHQLTDRLFFENTFGGAVHDGPLDQTGDSYGCSVNFRESATLGLKLNRHWRVMATVDHMSNANLCDRNAGLTNIGARVGYKY